MITQEKIDNLVIQYENVGFIKDDPIQFPHRFCEVKDIELAGFIASILSYGKRKVFIQKLNSFFDITQNEPCNFISDFEPKMIGDFNYRFGKPEDFAEIFTILKQLYNKDGGLRALFEYGYKNNENMFIPVSDYFYSNVKNKTQGFSFMIPDANKGCAMKRMCMFLRWMVREKPVDLGIWNFMPKSDLLIPLDVHVARISRKIGLLSRKQNDFKAVLELTNNLKKFDKNDPVKYDFAMFGYGVNESKDKSTREN